jgi:predicted nucleic acid-binding protein
MPIVLDANLLIVLVSQDARKQFVREKLAEAVRQGIPLHAPSLCLYEVANGLTRAIVAKVFTQVDVSTAFEQFKRLPITYHPLVDGERVVEIALQLQRQNAYDAAYLALTESLDAELWTLDSPLYRNAVGQGFRVKLIEASA